MKFVKPLVIRVGDVVGVIALSDIVERWYVKRGAEIIESWGLKVKLGKHLFAKLGDFSAGTASERREDVWAMINNPEVKLVRAAIGGYAVNEVLPVFTKEVMAKLRRQPKWFIGYSDACLILNTVSSFGMVNLHGPNLVGLGDWGEEWA
jgi:muramoyltetrapeptide carboxypeptidase